MLNLVFASKKALMRGVHDDVQTNYFKLLKNLYFGSSRSWIMSRSFITTIGLQTDYLLRHTIERLVGMDSKELELYSTYEGQNGFIFKLGI